MAEGKVEKIPEPPPQKGIQVKCPKCGTVNDSMLPAATFYNDAGTLSSIVTCGPLIFDCQKKVCDIRFRFVIANVTIDWGMAYIKQPNSGIVIAPALPPALHN